jgi:arylsulfatase A-like enzyme
MLLDSDENPEPQRVEDPEFYTTDAYGDRAVEFIEQHRAEPFFLYLPFNACHVPNEALAKYTERFAQVAEEERRLYCAMFSALDDAVGKVLAKLEERGLTQRTLIFFLSDNGGPMTKMGRNGSNNRPLKGQKGDTWEGGIRVPFLVQWKGKIPAGKTYDLPVVNLDVLPTVVTAAGGELTADDKLDGVNLLPHLTGENAEPPHATLYWRFGKQWAVRHGDWKLVVANGGSGKPELYNLADDISEAKDLAAEHPDKVAELQKLWDAWSKEQAEPNAPNQPAKQKKQAKRAAS